MSASRLKTFSVCQRQYRYKYIDKLPQEKTQNLVLGSSVHKAIERAYRDPKLQENRVELIIECYKNEVEQNGLELDPKALQDAAKIFDRYDFTRRTPRELELEFTLPFPNVAHPLCYINGYMDQVLDEGFVDMKTNKYKPRQYVLDNDLQFIIYNWAFQEIHGYAPLLKVWQHLRTGDEFDADVAGKEDLAIREIEKILETEFTGVYDKHVGDWCGWCPYQEPCLGKKY